MTAPDHPLPTSGGSFIRQADGSLVPAAEAAPAPVKPTVKGALKTPAKED
jgi:hypothetical protein